MNYTELLNQIIDNSGKMLKEIAEECQKSGVNLTNTYLSSLKTTSGKIASDDISRAIAKVCNAKYEDVLVVQAYLDRAPSIIIEFIEHTKRLSNLAGDMSKAMGATAEVLEVVESIQELTLAEYICETITESRKSSTDEILKLMFEKATQKAEPKCMVITSEQLKSIKLVNESDLKSILQ